MSWLNRPSGFTLIEMLVTIVILAILATVALPYAEVMVRRDKELDLSHSLRTVRTAIDDFHRDWREGLIVDDGTIASDNGFPKTLDLLVTGITLTDGRFRRYLRSIPPNPFARDAVDDPIRGWQVLGYRDSRDTLFWNGEDVYDIKAGGDGMALDGSHYANW